MKTLLLILLSMSCLGQNPIEGSSNSTWDGICLTISKDTILHESILSVNEDSTEIYYAGKTYVPETKVNLDWSCFDVFVDGLLEGTSYMVVTDNYDSSETLTYGKPITDSRPIFIPFPVNETDSTNYRPHDWKGYYRCWFNESKVWLSDYYGKSGSFECWKINTNENIIACEMYKYKPKFIFLTDKGNVYLYRFQPKGWIQAFGKKKQKYLDYLIET